MLSPAARLLLFSVALNPACTENDGAIIASLGDGTKVTLPCAIKKTTRTRAPKMAARKGAG